jgi:hypothetical protein
MTNIESKLQALRQEYKTATPDRKKEIEITANQIKKSANYYPVKVEYEDPFIKQLKKDLM